MAVLESRPELFAACLNRLDELQAYSSSELGALNRLAVLASVKSIRNPSHPPSDLPFTTESTAVRRSGTSTRATGSLSFSQLIREHEAKQKLRNLRDYLVQCAKPNDPTSFTAPAAQAILGTLISAFGNILTLPTAGLGHNGEIMLLWRAGAKSLEIEILPNQTIEFFGYDHHTEDAWEQSLSAGQAIPGSLLDMIRAFVTA
ncbi:MAG: hypothetical protein WBN89_04050 [Prochlorococcaceae cyanobacterium]